MQVHEGAVRRPLRYEAHRIFFFLEEVGRITIQSRSAKACVSFGTQDNFDFRLVQPVVGTLMLAPGGTDRWLTSRAL